MLPRKESKSKTWLYYYYCTECGHLTQTIHYDYTGHTFCDRCESRSVKWINTELNKYLD